MTKDMLGLGVIVLGAVIAWSGIAMVKIMEGRELRKLRERQAAAIDEATKEVTPDG